MGFLEEKHNIKMTIGTYERIELIFVSCSRFTIIEAVVTAGQPEASCAKLAGAWKRRRSTRTYSSSVRSFSLTVCLAFLLETMWRKSSTFSEARPVYSHSDNQGSKFSAPENTPPSHHPSSFSLPLSADLGTDSAEAADRERESGASEEGGGNLLRSSTNVTVGRIGNHAPVRCSHIV